MESIGLVALGGRKVWMGYLSFGVAGWVDVSVIIHHKSSNAKSHLTAIAWPLPIQLIPSVIESCPSSLALILSFAIVILQKQ